MPLAWIEDNFVRDVAPGNPADLYHPDIAVFYSVEVPEGIKNGATLVDGVWTNPPPPAPVEPLAPPRRMQLTPPEFKLQFTSAERIAIRTARAYAGNDTDALAIKAALDDWAEIVDDPRLTVVDLSLPQTQDALALLVAVGILTVGRKAEIERGVEA